VDNRKTPCVCRLPVINTNSPKTGIMATQPERHSYFPRTIGRRYRNPVGTLLGGFDCQRRDTVPGAISDPLAFAKFLGRDLRGEDSIAELCRREGIENLVEGVLRAG